MMLVKSSSAILLALAFLVAQLLPSLAMMPECRSASGEVCGCCVDVAACACLADQDQDTPPTPAPAPQGTGKQTDLRPAETPVAAVGLTPLPARDPCAVPPTHTTGLFPGVRPTVAFCTFVI